MIAFVIIYSTSTLDIMAIVAQVQLPSRRRTLDPSGLSDPDQLVPRIYVLNLSH